MNIDAQCVICNKDMVIPYYQRKAKKTCSKECSNMKIRLQKLKGTYLQCDMCDKLIYKMPTQLKRNNFCSYDCDRLYRSSVKSLGSHEKLLKERKKYYGENWRQITRKVRLEQDHKCSDCNISEEEYGQKLSVHHIKPFITFNSAEEANIRDNLVGVCEPCHRKRHSGKDHIMKLNHSQLGENAHSKYGAKNKRDMSKAKEVFDMLVNTDLTIEDISKSTGVHRITVTRIYKGQRWRDLYEGEPPIVTNPRRKASYSKP